MVGNDPIGRVDLVGLAAVTISTNCCKFFWEWDPEPKEIRAFLKSLPKDCMIEEFKIEGHGNPWAIDTTERDDDTTEGIEIGGVGSDGQSQITWTDNNEAIQDAFKGHVNEKTQFLLLGCNTGNTGDVFGSGAINSDETIASVLSQLFPGSHVAGGMGFGLGAGNFYQWGTVIGCFVIKQWYKNGEKVDSPGDPKQVPYVWPMPRKPSGKLPQSFPLERYRPLWEDSPFTDPVKR
jgi:hypothetical protein